MAGSLYETGLKRAMALCANREICLADMKQKLISWGVEDKDIRKIIDQLTIEKFIDEKRYAFAFVADKFRYNKWGKIKIASVLKMKKIPDTIIGEATNSINNDVYLSELKNLLANRRRITKSKNKYDLKGKLLRYGLSKGFESYLLYDLLNEDE